jgi:hypothetical protein
MPANTCGNSGHGTRPAPPGAPPRERPATAQQRPSTRPAAHLTLRRQVWVALLPRLLQPVEDVVVLLLHLDLEHGLLAVEPHLAHLRAWWWCWGRGRGWAAGGSGGEGQAGRAASWEACTERRGFAWAQAVRRQQGCCDSAAAGHRRARARPAAPAAPAPCAHLHGRGLAQVGPGRVHDGHVVQLAAWEGGGRGRGRGRRWRGAPGGGGTLKPRHDQAAARAGSRPASRPSRQCAAPAAGRHRGRAGSEAEPAAPPAASAAHPVSSSA